MITKDLLNKNRVLTMSNNRKCNYLVVDVGYSTGSGNNSASIIGINTQGKTKDILVLKEIPFNKTEDLVNEVYWTCKEFNIDIILADKQGFGIDFIDSFKSNIKSDDVNIRELSILKIDNYKAFINIKQDLENGYLRFLQTPEMAINSYQKSFLGFTNMMKFHQETTKLIDEIENIELVANGTQNIIYKRKDETIGKSRFNCLLLYYAYPEIAIVDKNEEYYEKQYKVFKRMTQYEVIHGVFYKYMFKAVENDNIKTIFYYENKGKIEQFRNIIMENKFKELFNLYINRIISCKDSLSIFFNNGSSIEFKVGNDSSRGYRYHFAVVDTDINMDNFCNAIECKGVLFDIAKEKGLLKDNYNIEFVQM